MPKEDPDLASAFTEGIERTKRRRAKEAEESDEETPVYAARTSPCCGKYVVTVGKQVVCSQCGEDLN